MLHHDFLKPAFVATPARKQLQEVLSTFIKRATPPDKLNTALRDFESRVKLTSNVDRARLKEKREDCNSKKLAAETVQPLLQIMNFGIFVTNIMIMQDFLETRYQYNDHEALFRTRYQFMIII